jgi:hypothetical protein
LYCIFKKIPRTHFHPNRPIRRRNNNGTRRRNKKETYNNTHTKKGPSPWLARASLSSIVINHDNNKKKSFYILVNMCVVRESS